MKLAFELVPDLATQIEPRHTFRLSVARDGAELPDACGSDAYLCRAMVLPGRPIAATGRAAAHRFEPDLHGINGVDGVLTAVDLTAPEDLDRLTVRLDNNLILSQEILQSFYSLRCRMDEKTVLLPLKSHLCRVDWRGLGLFEIDAGAFCHALLKNAGSRPA